MKRDDRERLSPILRGDISSQSTGIGSIIPRRSFDIPKKQDEDWLRPLAISLGGHVLLIVLFLFGLPSLWKKFPEEQVITFEMLPVTESSNIKTQKVQREKEEQTEEAKKVQQSKVEKPKEEVKPEPPKPEPAKEEPKKPEPAKEEPKKPEPAKEEPKKPEPPKEAEKIKEEPKPKEEPKKEEKPKPKEEKPKLPEVIKPKEIKPDKPKEKKKPVETDLDSLLKTLEKSSEGKEEKSKKQARSEQSDAEHEAKGEFNNENPLSISEYQAIRQQIESRWSVPVGAKDAGETKITLYIALKSDGTVEQVKLVDKRCPPSNAILCQASVESAIRAVWQASPLQYLSVERYNSWKEFEIVFDPSSIAS